MRHGSDKRFPLFERISLNQNTTGFIFLANQNTERECFSRKIFGLSHTGKGYKHELDQLVPDQSPLFLFNLQTRLLTGVFVPVGPAKLDIQPKAWKGRYRLQLPVKRHPSLRKNVTLEESRFPEFLQRCTNRCGLLNGTDILLLIKAFEASGGEYSTPRGPGIPVPLNNFFPNPAAVLAAQANNLPNNPSGVNVQQQQQPKQILFLQQPAVAARNPGRPVPINQPPPPIGQRMGDLHNLYGLGDHVPKMGGSELQVAKPTWGGGGVHNPVPGVVYENGVPTFYPGVVPVHHNAWSRPPNQNLRGRQGPVWVPPGAGNQNPHPHHPSHGGSHHSGRFHQSHGAAWQGRGKRGRGRGHAYLGMMSPPRAGTTRAIPGGFAKFPTPTGLRSQKRQKEDRKKVEEYCRNFSEKVKLAGSLPGGGVSSAKEEEPPGKAGNAKKKDGTSSKTKLASKSGPAGAVGDGGITAKKDGKHLENRMPMAPKNPKEAADYIRNGDLDLCMEFCTFKVGDVVDVFSTLSQEWKRGEVAKVVIPKKHRATAWDAKEDGFDPRAVYLVKRDDGLEHTYPHYRMRFFFDRSNDKRMQPSDNSSESGGPDQRNRVIARPGANDQGPSASSSLPKNPWSVAAAKNRGGLGAVAGGGTTTTGAAAGTTPYPSPFLNFEARPAAGCPQPAPLDLRALAAPATAASSSKKECKHPSTTTTKLLLGKESSDLNNIERV